MAKKSSGPQASSTKNADYIKRKSKLRRIHRSEILFNDKELDALDAYCKKHSIDNKAKFIRETVMKCVLEHFVEDYPTLFDKTDLDKLRV